MPWLAHQSGGFEFLGLQTIASNAQSVVGISIALRTETINAICFEKKRLGERQRTVSICEIQSGGGLKYPTQAKALLQKGIFWDNEDSF